MQNPYGNKAYHQTQIVTASREKILLMLYEGCIRYFKKTILAMEAKNTAEKGEMLAKAQDIIAELMNSLDHSKGGDIAKQLEGLYVFIFDESTQANIDNDPKKIQVCINILETLYTGWKGAIDQLQKQNAAVAAPKKLDVRNK
jgi:flagellar protein FliS